MALVFLLLLAGAGLAEAGRQNQNQREAKGSWGHKGYGRQRDHRNERQFFGHYRSRADSRHSSRRRRRSPSRRASSKKPAEAKESPGYLEYKQQKVEAQQWQERRLQAQALALCLEEREQQRLQAQTAAGQSSQPIPPLPHVGKQAAPEMAAPPPKEDFSSAASTPKPGALEGVSGADLIPTATLRLVEAELGHALSLGDKPLSAAALETKLSAAKRKGKSTDAFISRYGKGQNKALPTRVTAKAKVIAAIAQELRL